MYNSAVSNLPTSANERDCQDDSDDNESIGEGDDKEFLGDDKELFERRSNTHCDVSTISATKPPAKKRKATKNEEVDKMIIKTLQTIQDRKRSNNSCEHTQVDEEGHFGLQIAATLRRLTDRNKYIFLKIVLRLFTNDDAQVILACIID